MANNLSILYEIIISIQSCIQDLETKEIFIIKDLPKNIYDKYLNKSIAILEQIAPLKKKIQDMKVNNILISEYLEKEIAEKNVLIEKSIILSKNFWTVDIEWLVNDDLNKISEFVDWMIEIVNRIEQVKCNNKNENLQKCIEIWTIKFYSEGTKIAKFTIGKGYFDKNNVESSEEFRELWDYPNRQEALAVLYAIAKKYDRNKTKEFSIDFYSTEFDKDLKYFKENSHTFTNYRKIKKAIKETPPNKRYNEIVSKLKKFIDKYKWGIEIIDETFHENEKFTSKEEKKYRIKISV